MLKENVEGTLKGAMRHSGVACIIRDEEGNWLKGVAPNLGSCHSDQAELWGLLLGLELAWAERHKRTLIEIDSKKAYTLVKRSYSEPEVSNIIVKKCLVLLAKDWEVEISHSDR